MSSQKHIAQELLCRAHSPDTSEQLFAERVKQKPLHIRPTSPTPADNRARRRLHRLRKKEHFLRKRKPQPLSAREKRLTGVHDLPSEEVRYEVFKKLNAMWVGYMQEVLGLKNGSNNGNPVTPASHGSKLVSADFHGAELEVVRSTCVSRVGVKGIVVRDSKFVFVLVTEKSEVKTIPKEHTVFRFQVPLPLDVGPDFTNTEKSVQDLVFEIHGSQFEVRAFDRANKKFKWKAMDYL